jgi:16S rRNA processing protein RimM
VTEVPVRIGPDDLVELGVLRGPYGVKGWSHVQPHDPEAGVLRAARRWQLQAPAGRADADRPQTVEILGLRRHGSDLVAHWQFSGTGLSCDTPEAVQALRGWRILVARRDFPPLPAGETYWVDWVGLAVVNRAGTALGHVSGVRDNGGHELLEIRCPDGRSGLIPLVPAYLDAHEPEQGRVRVDWESDW